MYVEGEFDPRDRIFYSANPAFTRGAEETAKVETLLDPKVADALDVLHEARHGNIKFAGETAASHTLELMSVLRPHLPDEASSKLQKRATHITSYLGDKLNQQYQKRQAKFFETLDSPTSDRTLGSDYVINIHNAMLTGRSTKPYLIELGKAYAVQPDIFPKALQALSSIERQYAEINNNADNAANVHNAQERAARAKNEVVNYLANLPLPIETAEPEEIIALMGNAVFKKATHTLPYVELAPTGINQPSPLGGKNKDYVSNVVPANLESAILCAQFINSMARVRTPEQATAFVNNIYETALGNGHQVGAERLLELFNVTLLQNWPRNFESNLKMFSINLPPARFETRAFYRFASLLLFDRLSNYIIDIKEKAVTQNDAFSAAKSINFAVMGMNGLSEDILIDLARKGIERYGAHIFSEATSQLMVKFGEVAHKDAYSDTTEVWPIWHHKAQELRYEKARQAEAEDMVLTPKDAFARKTFERDSPEIDIDGRLRADYLEGKATHVLSHRGYFNTVAQLLAFEVSAASYEQLKAEIENLKTDIYVNGDYFVSPKGDRFIVDDKALKSAGLEHVTYRKMSGDQRYTQVEVKFLNTTITCVISPEMELLDTKKQPMELQAGLTEPLQYLIYGYLRALRCQPEAATGSKPRDLEESEGTFFVRRAHMRKLPTGHQPHQRQIDFAKDREDFDVVADNKWRAQNNLPIRTYVEETDVEQSIDDPNLYKSRQVTQRLKSL